MKRLGEEKQLGVKRSGGPGTLYRTVVITVIRFNMYLWSQKVFLKAQLPIEAGWLCLCIYYVAIAIKLFLISSIQTLLELVGVLVCIFRGTTCKGGRPAKNCELGQYSNQCFLDFTTQKCFWDRLQIQNTYFFFNLLYFMVLLQRCLSHGHCFYIFEAVSKLRKIYYSNMLIIQHTDHIL